MMWQSLHKPKFSRDKIQGFLSRGGLPLQLSLGQMFPIFLFFANLVPDFSKSPLFALYRTL